MIGQVGALLSQMLFSLKLTYFCFLFSHSAVGHVCCVVCLSSNGGDTFDTFDFELNTKCMTDWPSQGATEKDIHHEKKYSFAEYGMQVQIHGNVPLLSNCFHNFIHKSTQFKLEND